MKEMLQSILKPAARIRGGVSLPHRKGTADLETVIMPPPARVTLLMNQHIGMAAEPLVQRGAQVLVGQKVADFDRGMSVPIHASISGKVRDITRVRMPGGAYSVGLIIESDGQMAWDENCRRPAVKTREDLLSAIRESGLVGLGGAGFPTYVKLAAGEINTLIVNGAECEPYVTADYRECLENPWDILSGAYALKAILKIPNIIIAIERVNQKAIQTLRKTLNERPELAELVKLMELNSAYPQGAEKVLIRSATGRKVPAGKLPADIGCMVINITTLSFIGKYLKTGRPLVSRRITVAGNVQRPGNVQVPIGTSAGDLLNFCGGPKGTPRKIIMGGPMMGQTLADITMPVIKQTNALLVFGKKAVGNEEEGPCLRCGRCLSACPMSLSPPVISQFAEKKDTEGLEKCSAGLCVECGCCAYVCPAKRNLVQYMRLGKSILKERREQRGK